MVVSVKYGRHPNLPGSDQALLASIGEEVSSRLEATPGVQRVSAVNVDMFMMRDFMSEAECWEMMDQEVKPSTVYGQNEGIRTSQTCFLSAHPVVALIEQRMADLLGIPLRNSQPVQGQKYGVGQQFKMHNDYIAGGQPYSQSFANEGGQRTWTAMVYLNPVERGGFTSFPRARAKIAPIGGALLTWNNNDQQGLTNPFTHHEGMPVEAGAKYILTKWFREREWRPSKELDAFKV
jgi:prolyl 4-hydroxylase